MVSDMYAFDLETLVWERIESYPEDDVPRPRYFHSADTCEPPIAFYSSPHLTRYTGNNQLIVFGGMSNQPDSANPDELCVLNDVRFFDLATRHWLPGSPSSNIQTTDSLVPRARYAHLSSVTADRLFIIGGQDFFNTWLDDVCVYDLLGKAWVQRRDYPRHCGTYRSVAVSANLCVRIPQEERRPSTDAFGAPGSRFREEAGVAPNHEFTTPDSLQHQTYSAPPTEEHPADIFLYSNYNVCPMLLFPSLTHHCSSPTSNENLKFSLHSLTPTSQSRTAPQ